MHKMCITRRKLVHRRSETSKGAIIQMVSNSCGKFGRRKNCGSRKGNNCTSCWILIFWSHSCLGLRCYTEQNVKRVFVLGHLSLLFARLRLIWLWSLRYTTRQFAGGSKDKRCVEGGHIHHSTRCPRARMKKSTQLKCTCLISQKSWKGATDIQ